MQVPRPCFWQNYRLPGPVQTLQRSSLLRGRRSRTRVGRVTQVLQVPGGARGPRLRLHGSVADVASRAPRTHRSLRGAGRPP